jgi:hypothetical protein
MLTAGGGPSSRGYGGSILLLCGDVDPSVIGVFGGNGGGDCGGIFGSLGLGYSSRLIIAILS